MMRNATLKYARSVPSLVTSLLLGMAIWSIDGYSQEAGPPNADQQSFGIDPSSSIESRIGELPPEIVRRYVDRGVAAPVDYDLSSEQRRRFSAALEALTPLHQTVLQKHLRSVSFVDGIPFNGQTVLINPGSSEAAFDIIFNAIILDETLSEFATRRERQLFETGDSQLTVTVVAGSMDAVTFVLVHEATHVVDLVLGLTPPPSPLGSQIQEQRQTPFARGVWESFSTPVGSYRGSVLDKIPSRNAGVLLDIEEAQTLYEDLERTPFVSVYASVIVIEDIAELVAWRQMTEKYGQPYRIELRDDAGTIYSYEPMMSPLVRSRLNRLDMFDSPEIVGSP